MKNMGFPVLYEDEDVLVIDKPSGVVVNDAATTPEGTVQAWHKQRLGEASKEGEVAGAGGSDWQSLVPLDFDLSYGEPEEIFAQRDGIVHRLDKDTSGVLVLAKNPGSLVNLLTQFKQRQIEKDYTCLVHGFLSAKMDVLRFALDRHARYRMKFAVNAEGKMAETRYQVIGEFTGLNEAAAWELEATDVKRLLSEAKTLYQGFSLLECVPKTGRTHQIRVHLAHVQHPLVGDATYVGKKRQRLDLLWCPRQFLHASRLQFRHPRTGELVTVVSELAPDLQQVLGLLEAK